MSGRPLTVYVDVYVHVYVDAYSDAHGCVFDAQEPLLCFVFSCCSKQAENTFVCLALDFGDAKLQVDRHMDVRYMDVRHRHMDVRYMS